MGVQGGKALATSDALKGGLCEEVLKMILCSLLTFEDVYGLQVYRLYHFSVLLPACLTSFKGIPLPPRNRKGFLSNLSSFLGQEQFSP